MEALSVKIINKSSNPLPEYATDSSAGMDLRADVSDSIIINPGERLLIGTGLSIELPDGCEAQIRPRSGLAFKFGITVLNAPGTIDSDYRGEIKVLLINHGNESFSIKPGERIAQMVINRVNRTQWDVVQILSPTERGSGGYGHTGML